MQHLHAAREEMIQRDGARALDALLTGWLCKRCRTRVGDPALRTIAHAGYRTLSGLVLWARQACASLDGVQAPRCDTCGGRARVARRDYHAFHSGLAKDIVVRWEPRGPFRRARHRLFVWDPEGGHAPLGALDADAEATLSRDAWLREVAVQIELDGLTAALPRLQEAARVLAGDPAVLDYVPALLEASHHGFAGSLVQDHVSICPDDPEGHYWLGRLLVEGVAAGRWPEDRLDAAAARFRAVLERDRDHLAARLALEEVEGMRRAAVVDRQRGA